MSLYYDSRYRHRSPQLGQCLAGLALGLCLWYGICKVVANPLLPSPLSCLRAAWHLVQHGAVFRDVISSLVRILLALATAVTLALPLALTGACLRGEWNPIVPVVEALRPVPPIACLPIALAIFGATDSAARAIIVLGAFFPLYSAIKFGAESIPTNLRDAALFCRWSRLERLRWLVLPYMLPHFLNGFRIALGIAWMCVVAAEMLGVNSGLGYQIELNRQILRLDNVLVYMLICSAMGAGCMSTLGMVENQLLRWRHAPQLQSVGVKLPAPVNTPILENNQCVAISADHITYSYPSSHRGIRDVRLNVEDSSIHVILGPSGCGKSTLLQLVAGMRSPDSGVLRFLQDSPGPIKLAYLTQDPALFPWMSVGQQVRRALPPDLRSEENELGMLRLLGITKLRNAYPQALSGGQRQRVALARALATQPKVLLLDEPFAHLDPIARELMQSDLRALCLAAKLTTLMVTHDISEALALADEISIMNAEGAGFSLHFKNAHSKRSSQEYFQSELLLRAQLFEAHHAQKEAA